MFSKYKIILAFFVVNMLAACGGGDSGSSSTPAPYVAPATYGAIAVNIYSQNAGYTGYGGAYGQGNQASQAAANAAVLAGCKALATTTNCFIALEFGANTCGSIARSITTTSGIYGTGTGSSGSLAEAAALSVCVRNGGANCIVPTSTHPLSLGSKLTACNGSASVTAITAAESNGSLMHEQEGSELIDYNDPK